MNKLAEFLTEGTITFKKVQSPINGELVVKWDSYAGYQIMGGGLWQVGGPVEDVWRAALKSLPNDFNVSRALILGLGGGSAAKLIRKKWGSCVIDGVDIDPVIVDLGNTYLGMSKHNVNQIIDDAFIYVSNRGKSKSKYELICVDTYVESTFPEKFDSEEFLINTASCLSVNGVLMVNRLYSGKDRALAHKFKKKLTQLFDSVDEVYPETENVVFVCSGFIFPSNDKESKNNQKNRPKSTKIK